jgi:SET domain-containing protein
MEHDLSVVARTDIEAGDELFMDYALVESEEGYLIEACSCGSQQCRGLITGQD